MASLVWLQFMIQTAWNIVNVRVHDTVESLMCCAYTCRLVGYRKVLHSGTKSFGPVVTLSEPKSEDKFLHTSIQTFRFFSVVHLSLRLDSLFPLFLSLFHSRSVCTSCYLICVVSHFTSIYLCCCSVYIASVSV